MNTADVRTWVDKIRSMAGDDEAAHSSEDYLRTAVLKAIAEGCDNPAELARAALETEEIDFARWCA